MSKFKDGELEAAAAFRDTLSDRADDMKHGVYPLWHGWALVDAFHAGVEWARKNSATKLNFNP